uniref:Uncharacterized protein n=1 Tax=Glossina palpalis gambiensis TaxID=67801 RepID=A0A1B0B731_9MUSC
MEASRVTVSRNLKFAISHAFEASILIKDAWLLLEDADIGQDLIAYGFEMTKIATKLFEINKSIVDPARFTGERVQTCSPVATLSGTAAVQTLPEAPPNCNNSRQDQIVANMEVQNAPDDHVGNQEQNETRSNIEIKTLLEAQLHSRNQEQNQTTDNLKVQKLEDSQPPLVNQEQKQIKNVEAKNLTNAEPHAGIQQESQVKAVQGGQNLQSGQPVLGNTQEKQIKHNLGGQHLEDLEPVLVNQEQKQIKYVAPENLTKPDPHAGIHQEKLAKGVQRVQSAQPIIGNPQQKQITTNLGGQNLLRGQPQFDTHHHGAQQITPNLWGQNLLNGQFDIQQQIRANRAKPNPQSGLFSFANAR